MLVISRKPGEKILISDEIEITILEIGRNRVRLGFEAPRHIRIQTHVKSSLDEPAAKHGVTPDKPADKLDLKALPTAVGMFGMFRRR